MMRRIGQFLTQCFTSPRYLAITVLLVLLAPAIGSALWWAARWSEVVQVALTALALVLVLALAGSALLWLWRRRVARQAIAPDDVSPSLTFIPEPEDRAQTQALQVLRDRMHKAVATLRGSRMGRLAGRRALYELSWCMLIGSPGSGKSSAVQQSGLQFPFEAGHAAPAPGSGATCDWYLAREGIVLDMAGRYATDDGSRAEWRSWLDMLKKQRPRAPLNGVVLAVSVEELRGDPEAARQLARSLRQRMQDMVERLAVFAPVYVLFTKADRIAGFSEFFAQSDHGERERAWGATMPYKRRAAAHEVLAFFDHAYGELDAGLKELGVAILAQPRNGDPEPGVLTFPLEFAAMRSTVRTFLAALFEENPFQDGMVFRGFYFSSAVRDGAPASEQPRRIAERFGLAWKDAAPAAFAMGPRAGGRQGYFLLRLFRDVIFADQALVTHYASRNGMRLRYAAYAGALLLLGAGMAGWAWSYQGNRQLAEQVQADLEQVARMQVGRRDLQSRLEALEVLENRIAQLESLDRSRPWSLGMGLFQGPALADKLRAEYFAGVREVMVAPATASLEALLAGLGGAADASNSPDKDAGNAKASKESIAADDGYNALKAYLMLADPAHVEPGHLNDQLARHWRSWLEANRGAMPREQLVRSAERLLAFYTGHAADPSWPRVAPKLALVDQARTTLRSALRGMPARERVYAAIRARAGTRFAAITVARIIGPEDQALVTGSAAVPGAYTREAWKQYVDAAFRDAANGELQSTDWVLKSSSKDDLTLEGSPEQVRAALVERYKADYVQHWRLFLQGVAVADMEGVPAAVAALNRLGDPQASPLVRVLSAVHEQTSWDAPLTAGVAGAGQGMTGWLGSHMPWGGTPAAAVLAGQALAPGAVAREFGALARLFALQGVTGAGQSGEQQGAQDGPSKEGGFTLMRGYADALARVRMRLHQLNNQGDPGPGARQLMQQTLDGNGSELADALRHVDERMLAGLGAAQQQSLRPLLVRPLMQAYAAVVTPAEAEINKTWQVQVYQPFQRALAGKYPFTPGARVEAGSAEIAEFFGPEGVIAKFAASAIGPLAVRRGDVLAPRTWAGLGIALSPQAVARLPAWIAAPGTGGMGGNVAQTVFQLMPLLSPDVQEYTVEIDGQQVRQRMPAAPVAAVVPTVAGAVSGGGGAVAPAATAMSPISAMSPALAASAPLQAPQWHAMVHPGPDGGVPGARIVALARDGRSVELFNQAGNFGLKRMIDAATRKRKDDGVYELRWDAGGVSVAVDLKIVSSPEAGGAQGGGQGGGEKGGPQGLLGLKLPEIIAGKDAAAPANSAVATIAAGAANSAAAAAANANANAAATPATAIAH